MTVNLIKPFCNTAYHLPSEVTKTKKEIVTFCTPMLAERAHRCHDWTKFKTYESLKDLKCNWTELLTY